MSKVFFSSCFQDPRGQRLSIRDRLIEFNLAQVSGVFDRDDPAAVAALPIWMAEQHPALDQGAPTSPLGMAEICVQGVRDCDVYVALVRTDHGTGVELLPDEKTQASFFELELFEAALLQKPAYIFVLDGGAPSDRLAGLLELLGPAFPGFDPTPRTQEQIYDRVRALADATEQARKRLVLRQKRASSRQMSDSLTGARFNIYDPKESAPNLRFLGGGQDHSLAPPNLDLVRDAMARASGRANHQERLTLIWIAIRELMGAPIESAPTSEIIELWSKALGEWNTAGAWYGLHGHPLMGCLAALGSLSALRITAARADEIPHGAMSSEYYSIAKLVGRRDLKAAVLGASRAHIDAAFLRGKSAGKYAQRGSVRSAQGDTDGAIEDYRRVVGLRIGVEQASSDDIGQAKTELGFALVMAGRRAEGLAELEDGIQLFDERPTGFLIRAQRKLGRAYIRAGAPLQALDVLAKAHHNAEITGALDQVSQIDKIAHQLAKTLGRPT